jgi:hypothetical protein
MWRCRLSSWGPGPFHPLPPWPGPAWPRPGPFPAGSSSSSNTGGGLLSGMSKARSLKPHMRCRFSKGSLSTHGPVKAKRPPSRVPLPRPCPPIPVPHPPFASPASPGRQCTGCTKHASNRLAFCRFSCDVAYAGLAGGLFST